MNRFIVPAQITTLEDKIAGNLSLTQVILLLSPFFLSTFIYLAIAPHSSLNLQKGLGIGTIFVMFATLALRVRDRTILSWLALLAGYYFRPHLFIPDKNDLYLRDLVQVKSKAPTQSKVLDKKHSQAPLPIIPTINLVELDRLQKNPRKSISFTFKKKGIAHVFKK